MLKKGEGNMTMLSIDDMDDMADIIHQLHRFFSLNST